MTKNTLFKKLNSINPIYTKTASAFIVRCLGAVSGFLLNLTIARTLAANDAGFYFLAISVIQILATIGQIGLSNSLLRFVSSFSSDDDWENTSSVYKTGVTWSLILTCFIMVAIWYFSDILSSEILKKPELAPVLRAMVPSVVFFAILNLTSNALLSLGFVAKSIFLLNVLIPSLMGLVLISGISNNAESAAYSYSISCLISLILSLLWWFRKKGIRWLNVSMFSARTLWSSCFPLWTVSLMGQLVQWGGQIISGAYVSSEDLATLAVAQRTAMLASLILVAINMTVAPRFAVLYKNGKREELEALVISSSKLIVILAAPLLAVMLAYPEWFLYFFGKQYQTGTSILQILVIGQLFNLLGGPTGYLISMSGHERDFRNIVFVSSSTLVLISLILVPSLGIMGAAAAMTISLGIQNLLSILLVNKRLNINPIAFNLK